jgi:DNA-binding response OmpR family regulator
MLDTCQFVYKKFPIVEPMKILIVEDEPKLASYIQKGLEEQAYEVQLAYDGLMGKRMASGTYFDIIIMDVNLPKLNGFDLASSLRSEKVKTPILMLTALGTTEDKLAGFDSGADDYLVKPFEFRELLARIRALHKRSSEGPIKNGILKIADLEVNLDDKTVQRAGRKLELTAKEFSLLEYLIRNKGRVVSRVDIAEKVWDLHFDTGTNVIDVYVNFLRKKVDKSFPTKLIHTVVGMGYIMKEE